MKLYQIMSNQIELSTRGSMPWHLPPRTYIQWTSALLLGILACWFSTASVSAQQQGSIATGKLHSCAVTSSGGAMCWGSNAKGQLGDNSTTNTHIPVNVSGLSSGVVAIVAGGEHSCALTSSGGVKCWGEGTVGQLGNSASNDSLVPVDVTGLTSGVAAIAAGDLYSCALTVGGAAKCWGSNDTGRLGDGQFSNSNVPVDVSGLASGVVAIATNAVGMHTCVLTDSGTAKCWGQNANGRLGNGTTTSSNTPVDVTGLSGLTKIATGTSHSCAVTTGGGVKCWGANYGTTAVDVVEWSSGVVELTAGRAYTCTILATGRAQCVGYNEFGQSGKGYPTAGFSTPARDVAYLPDAAAIRASEYHTCAVNSSGEVKCWGQNTMGQIGVADNAWWSVPPETSVLGGTGALLPANLNIAKSDPTPYPPVAGQPVQYTVWVTNTGIVSLTNLTVTDLPSADLTMTAFSSTPSGTCNTGTQQCVLDAPLAPGASASFLTTFNTGATAGAVISNTVYATADELSLGRYPTTPIVTVKSAAGESTVDLAISKSASLTEATSGTTFDYTLTVVNNGPDDATNVVATDLLPAGITFNSATATGGGSCSESGGTVTCTWPTVTNGTTVTATISVTS